MPKRKSASDNLKDAITRLLNEEGIAQAYIEVTDAAEQVERLMTRQYALELKQLVREH